MLDINNKTIGEVFREAADRWASQPLLIAPLAVDRAYHPQGYEISYREAAAQIEDRVGALKLAGFGHGHRLAVLLENRPEHMLYKLACAAAGLSWVPINPDYRAGEVAYLLEDSAADLIVTVPERANLIDRSMALCDRRIPVHVMENMSSALPEAIRSPPHTGSISPSTECSLIYTSGTTGQPKGCIIGHEYELMMAKWYSNRGGLLDIREASERIYNPLPMFHINSAIISFMGAMVSGNCQIQPERFSANAWWPDVQTTRATIVHYLGLIAPILMNVPPGPMDRNHTVRMGIGAGIEPSIHATFEERFGFPMIEVWGMTEMCRFTAACHEPRQIETRAIGWPVDTLEIKVFDGTDREVPPGTPGELVVRHSATTPRRGAFSGYLNKPQETERAWRSGWFHTGDTVCQDESGMLSFVDRSKNIIRRGGENIAAAEVEACLLSHPQIAKVAVIAQEDAIREEEVMACVVVKENTGKTTQTARNIFDHCYENIAYFKAPGWLVFVDDLPVTGTQKVLKHKIFPGDEDPSKLPDAHDFRDLKKR